MDGKVLMRWIKRVVAGTMFAATAALAAAPAYQPVSDWRAEWIGPAAAVAAKPNTWLCFRKTAALAAVPKSAKTRIAVDSKYWLYVNGELAVREGQLKRGPTPEDTFFDEVDLAPHLKKGENTFAVLVWFWGKHGFSHKSSGRAGLLFQMEAEGQAGVISDAGWKGTVHPAYGETGAPHPNSRLPEHNVRFDAARDIPDWFKPGFDDAGWSTAVSYGKPPCAPWNALWPRPVGQWKDFGLRDYANAAELPREGGGDFIRARLPYNAQVMPWLEVEGPAGQAIDIRTDSYQNTGEKSVRTEYVTRAGVQAFECPNWMSGHVVEYRIPAGVKIRGLKFRETGLRAEFSGRFVCNDEALNTLWKKSARTLYVTMRDTYMDCPERERAQWWGDAVNELGEVFYCMNPEASLLTRKAIHDLCNWQRPNKTVYSPVPAGNWNQELPPQMLASVGQYGFWTYGLYSGDAQAMLDAYPHVKDYLGVWQTGPDGLILHRSGEWDWTDWGDQIDVRLADNMWFCLALEGAANMADLAGKPDEAAAFRARRVALMEVINRVMWNGKAYRTPTYGGQTDDRGNALAVVAGVAGPDKHAAVKQVLAAEYHASPYMEKYVLEALFLMNDPDAAVARMKKRYAGMIKSPWTTLFEHWQMQGGTYNHGWSGGPLTLMSQYVAGIAPLEPGFKRYQIMPQPGPLKEVACAVDSVAGLIDVTCRIGESGRFSMNVTSPPGTEALAGVPRRGAFPTIITVNGVVVWKAGDKPSGRKGGARFVGEDARYVRLSLPEGRWSIETK